MTDLIRTFQELEAHAREWLDFSQDAYGWVCRCYGDVHVVRCYFADARNHRSVTLGEYGCEIQVAFHSQVLFGDITLKTLQDADRILQRSREMLDAERQKVAQRSREVAAAEKQARIDALRQELADLSGVLAPEVAA